MDGQTQTREFLTRGVMPQGGPVVVELPPDQIAPGGPGWHDQVYRAASGDMAKVPWAHGRATPPLVAWLNAEAPGRVRPGSRAAVVGCGLGDDVVELINRGYDAIGFDVSPTGIDWARRRFPQQASAFVVADVLGTPTRFRHRFDLVVEVNTIQSMDPAQREAAATAIGTLVCPRGVLVVIARGREESELLENVQGPPWPLTKGEMVGLMESAGLKPSRGLDEFMDDSEPPQRRLRGVFERA
jgi:hypothetical protein